MLFSNKHSQPVWKILQVTVAVLVWLAGSGVAQSDDQSQAIPADNKLDLSWLSDGDGGQLTNFNEAVQAEALGARRFLQGKSIERYSSTKILEQIKQHNLQLEQQAHKVSQTKEDLVVSKAVFNPDLNFSLQYNRSRSRERIEDISRLREVAETWQTVVAADVGTEYYASGTDETLTVTADDVDKTWFEMGVAANSCVVVDGDPISDTCDNDQILGVASEYASYSDKDWNENWSGSMDISKFFPWGSGIQAGLNTTYTPYKESQSVSLKAVGAALEVAQGLGRAQWASNVSVGFRTPLPYSKNFGRQGTYATVNSEQAELTVQKSIQAQNNRINSEFRDGLTAYWELVRSVLAVESSLLNRNVLAKRLEVVKRQFKHQRITEYDLTLAEAGLEDAGHQEEVAWNGLILRTNNLSEILNLPPEQVVLPTGFLDTLLDREDLALEEVLDSALSQRAEIKMAIVESNGHKLEEQFRSQQLKPDLSLDLSYKVLGKGSAALYGYDSFGDSISALFRPDEQQFFVGLNFSYPLGNHIAKSKYSQARTSYQRSLDKIHDTEIGVTKEMNNALSDIHSRKSRVLLAHASIMLADSAFKTTQRLREKERITEFEFLQQHKALTEARIELINALIDQRLAYINVLAAQGVLGKMLDGNQPITGAKQ